jgi:NifB/MoaA-like Fe-S oxidoreductase
MTQLRVLQRQGIAFHTQVVICPGINDGAVLRRTVSDLLSLKRGLLSIGVVPVGLTRFRRAPLKAVTPGDARDVCTYVERVGRRLKASRGRRLVYAADELFLRAGRPIPPRAYYEGYPQLDNGIGLIRSLLDDWQVARRRLRAGAGPSPKPLSVSRRWALLTSESACAVMARISRELSAGAPGIALDVFAVRNRFFGETVTVAGLLAARDVIAQVNRLPGEYRTVVLPGVMFNGQGHTLDGFSRTRIERATGRHVRAPRTIEELVALVNHPRGNERRQD